MIVKKMTALKNKDLKNKEQISDGETHLLAPYKSPVSVSATMASLMEDPQLRARLGRALGDKAVRPYSVEVVPGRWKAHFIEVSADAG